MDYKPMEDDGGLTEPLQGREAPGAVVGSQYCLQKAEQFTLENAVLSKDWSITNANGQEVYRVRGKRLDVCKPKRELVDLEGNPIVFMKRKSWSWTRTWRAFEPGHQASPLWTIKKRTFCSFRPRLAIFLPSNTERKIPDYSIRGQFLCKRCMIYFGEQEVAEVVREVSLKNIFSRKSIFHVLVQPGVDTAFIFSVIVMMDKLYIHSFHNYGGGASVGGT